MEQEGVIKFELEHRSEPLPVTVEIAELEAARQVLFARQLIGRDPARYGGLGYGNLSRRHIGHQFIVSGSQTGDKPDLVRQDYALVERFDLAANKLWSLGEIKPSSESTTHALLYSLSDGIGAVIHVHAPAIWQQVTTLDLPATPVDAPYGSQALVKAVTDLWRRGELQRTQVFVMLGHQDGVIAYGEDLDEALEVLLPLDQRSRTLAG